MAFDLTHVSRLTTYREILMMQVMNSITEKPEWDRKVFDDGITSKWCKEISGSGKDVTPKMMDWIIKELQFKADVFQKTGQITAFDPGVVKSDTIIPSELQQSLQEAVRPLENVPEYQKDYHPGSDNKVVDLVHPSLFPVIYDRSCIITDKTIGLDDCLDDAGQAKLLSTTPEHQSTHLGDSDVTPRRWLYDAFSPYSRKFQWMPCDIEFADGDECRIASYINNLHPQENRTLYEILERIIARTIPLWDTTLTRAENEHNRIEYTDVEYLNNHEPEPTIRDGEDEKEFWNRYYNWELNRTIKRPEPGEFRPLELFSRREVKLRSGFSENGLQVIVKLANIELNPEKPDYDGGSWHVEGQLNEHICASAIYYYDSENITESTLAFRQRSNTEDMSEIGYEQQRHEFLQEVFGFGDDVDSSNETNVTQNLGSVATHEGRVLTFPNTLQHRVSPFSLADRSKPGHRKILALFLVDPHLRIISSANIPPQREDWWKERRKVVGQLLGGRLPVQLQDMVTGDLGATCSISMDEAKQYRLELMEERKTAAVYQNEKFEAGDFNLCEH
ncbi:hypothetical protein PHISP_03556 [Aspergillus sp. HF37]|nr:hypothetical protein PHISP_03556 [Aspergillus sp. HF37]